VNPDDDFDCLSIEIASGRLAVWTDAGMREATLPHAPRDAAKVLGRLIGSRGDHCKRNSGLRERTTAEIVPCSTTKRLHEPSR
jgi:hypothetical protein